MKHFFLCFLTLCIVANDASAQSDSAIQAIKGIACVKQDRIMIRWAPSGPAAWYFANISGYMIQRSTIYRNNKLLKQPETINLNIAPLLPWPLTQWEKDVKANKYIAIAAQAIYGQTFIPKMPDSQGVMQILNKARELENRYSFAMYAASQSAILPRMMGIGFTDTLIARNEKYVYKIYALVPPSKIKIDTGYIFADASVLSDYPKIIDIRGEATEKAMKLQWETRMHAGYYAGYIIQRSENGKDWIRVNEDPVVQLENGTTKEKMFYIDSLPKLSTYYYYRICGMTFFAEEGPCSVTVGGIGYPRIPSGPKILSVKQGPGDVATISWSIPGKYKSLITRIEITAASDINTKHIVLATVGGNVTVTTVRMPFASNYMVVKATSIDGEDYKSLPVLYQSKDNTPPLPPTSISGVIDTNGIVTLRWKSNAEPDLYGYRIFVANSIGDEFTNITKKMKKDTVFKDTITLKTLSEKIFYKIVALDNHFNPSLPSATLELTKPDKIKPSKPVFDRVISTDTAIYLSWIPSSSTDVVRHELWRQQVSDQNWRQVYYHLPESPNSFADREPQPGKLQNYVLYAVDDAGNKSEATLPMQAKKIDTGIRPAMKNIKISADRDVGQITLYWNYKYEGVSHYMIYRQDSQGQLRLYKTVTGDRQTFADDQLTINANYVYKVMAKYKDGGSSPMSEALQILY